MRITIVTLCDYGMTETFVGAIWGDVAEEDRAAMAVRFGAVLGLKAKEDEAEDEDARILSFRSVEPSEGSAALRELLSADDTVEPMAIG